MLGVGAWDLDWEKLQDTRLQAVILANKQCDAVGEEWVVFRFLGVGLCWDVKPAVWNCGMLYAQHLSHHTRRADDRRPA